MLLFAVLCLTCCYLLVVMFVVACGFAVLATVGPVLACYLFYLHGFVLIFAGAFIATYSCF